MTAKVFIDGEAGTTGLQIRERLETRDDITLISVDHAERKSPEARAAAFAEADIGILCLPDAAAIEAVKLAGDCRLIDASTAHRVADDWTYGMPELPGQTSAIAAADRVANVGCFATASIAILRPLTDAGLLPVDYVPVLTGVSGYTGGGKSMIAEFDDGTAPDHFLYATGQTHKHVPEIVKYGGLSQTPFFQPAVGNYAQGMLVQLHLAGASVPANQLSDIYEAFYADAPFINVTPAPDRIDVTRLKNTNFMEINILGNGVDRVTVAATLDNLGKGASGTAVQNLNLMIGASETIGL